MEPSGQRAGRILVVEDDIEVGAMVVDHLRGSGYDVSWETTGQGGLRVIQEGGLAPDLIILDLLLPDIPGEDVYAGVAAHPEWPPIPVIVMSGLPTGAARGRLLPRSVYIQKPFDPPQLLALVAQYVGPRASRPESGA